MRIAILDDYHQAFGSLPPIARLRQHPQVDEVRIVTEPFASVDDMARRVGDCEIFIAIRERTRFPADVFERLPALRFIAQTGNHAYHIDLAAATRHRIAVGLSATPSGGSRGAAELTIGLMLALVRRIPYYNTLVHQGEWEVPFGWVLEGKTLGILGLGKVGKHVAHLASAFGMRILAWSPTLTAIEAARLGAERMDLDALLSAADIVTVHAALSDASRGLLDAKRLARLRPQAFLINTARGPIIDEAALVDLLQHRRIAGAALDVFDREPLPPDHPLTRLDNVILTPHIGWPTDAAYASFAQAAAIMVEHFLARQYDEVVNLDAILAPGKE